MALDNHCKCDCKKTDRPRIDQTANRPVTDCRSQKNENNRRGYNDLAARSCCRHRASVVVECLGRIRRLRSRRQPGDDAGSPAAGPRGSRRRQQGQDEAAAARRRRSDDDGCASWTDCICITANAYRFNSTLHVKQPPLIHRLPCRPSCFAAQRRRRRRRRRCCCCCYSAATASDSCRIFIETFDRGRHLQHLEK